MIQFDKPMKRSELYIPNELLKQDCYEGEIYGFVRNDTGVHTILAWGEKEIDPCLQVKTIGGIGTKFKDQEGIYGYYEAGSLHFTLNNKEMSPEQLITRGFDLISDIYSRQVGVLETDNLLESGVVIVGCGSAGSSIAMLLARSGVGRFLLIDTDIFSIHNICRHQCDLTDVGRFKVDALKDRIFRVNPQAEVITTPKLIQDAEKELEKFIDEKVVVVGCGDNRLSAAVSCDLAIQWQIPYLSLCFWQRASVAEIFTHLPEQKQVCYRCMFPEAIEKSIKEMQRNHFYIGEEEVASASFEPGIYVDIEYGTTIAAKILLDMLNLHRTKYHDRILHSLTQFTLACNTNIEEIGGESVAIFPESLTVVKNIHPDVKSCKHD